MDVAVVGDGPGGLSAAIFLAKNGQEVAVYGEDNTAMHWALLKNYPGIAEIRGSDYQKIARQQAESFGAKLIAERVDAIDRNDDGFVVTLDSGESTTVRFVILSEGKSPRLAKALGLEFAGDGGVVTDKNSQTSISGVYAVGRLSRPGRSQAVISAGDGAAAAIEILSTLKGEDLTDWDSPPES